MLLSFRVLDAKLKKLLHTVAKPACDLLNREKITKYEVWQRATHTPFHAARTEKIK